MLLTEGQNVVKSHGGNNLPHPRKRSLAFEKSRRPRGKMGTPTTSLNVPLESGGQFVAVANGGAEGKWYSLGDDVNAVFFKETAPAGVLPTEAVESFLKTSSHDAAYKLALTAFASCGRLGTVFGSVLFQIG